MLKNIHSRFWLLPLLILLIFLSSCISDRKPHQADNHLSLYELLQLVPTESKTQLRLVNEAIINQGADGLFDLCLMLNDADEQIRIRAEYALAAVANHVLRPGAVGERKIFLEGIYRALEERQLYAKRSFLIGILTTAGNESSVQPLTKYLYDEKLCALVVPTLLQCAPTVAGKELLAVLPEVPDKNKVVLLQGLGELKYLPAGKVVMDLTEDPDPAIKAASRSALANMGYAAARSVFQRDLNTGEGYVKDHAVANYLIWISRLGDKKQAIRCCKEILADTGRGYTDHHRFQALAMLIQFSRVEGLDEVFSFIHDRDEKWGMEAVQGLGEIDTAELLEHVTARKSQLSPVLWAEFIDLLGHKKDPASLPVIKESLQDGATLVRIAAIHAIVKINGKESLKELVPLLETSNDPLVLNTLQAVFAGIPRQDLVPHLLDHYARMNVSGKKLVLGIMGKHRDITHSDFVIQQLSSTEPDIRMTAIDILPEVVDIKDLDLLIKTMMQSIDQEEKEMLFTSILKLISKYADNPRIITLLTDLSQNTDTSNRRYFFKMLKQSGSDSALTLLLNETRTVDPDIRDQAMRILLEWPRLSALDHLVAVVHGKEEMTYRVLATRSCLRLLQENDLGKEIEFQYYKKILESTPRVEEKKMMIAALAALKSEKSLRYLFSLSSDPALGPESILAIMNMVKSSPDSAEAMTGTEIAKAFLQESPTKGPGEGIVSTDHQSTNRPPDGFTALFNGRDLQGWQGLVSDPPGRRNMAEMDLRNARYKADRNMIHHWKVIDGILCFDGQGENLCTVGEYRNFELWVDWKIEKKGDSGIYLRGSPQVQIWDPAKNPVGSGGLFNNLQGPAQPLKRADHPVGEWNTFHIIMRGQKVTIYLNDILVVENTVLENYWERDKPIYDSGTIELQAHFNPLYFKNIFIRELPEEEMPFSGALFNGEDLSGWMIVDGQPGNWQVENRILFTTGKGGGWISTDRTFSNFKLELEYRLPDGGNSGIFLRAPQEGDPAYTGMEIQLLDDYAGEYANLKSWQYTGSIYGVQAPAQRVSKPSHNWQKIVVECRGPRIKVILNDVLIVDTDLIEYMDKEVNHPGLKRRSGFIGLQNHSTRVEFKNIRIQELD